MLTRRDLIVAGSALAGACATASLAAKPMPAFIHREGKRLVSGGR